MQYGEFTVADYLSKHIKNSSVFIPASAQEKGIDLLLYRYNNGQNLTNTFQIKMSRTYYDDKPNAKHPYYLWFNRFPIHNNADWYVLVGIYAKRPEDAQNAKVSSTNWDKIMLAFKNEEMAKFMSEVKQKKDAGKDDMMFGFGFDDEKNIFQTRGYFEERDMTDYLIDNRLHEIEESFK